MKFTQLLPLVALSSAFVIPDEQVMSQVAIESHHKSDSIFDRLPSKNEIISDVKDTFSSIISSTKNAFDEAIELASETSERVISKFDETAFDAESWFATADSDSEDHGKHGKHGDHDHHGHHGHHGHHHKPNMTVYQLIAESKYTTKLAKLISEYDDLVQLLNGTAANYTVFAPTDKAFEKIPEHAPKPSKELLKEVLTYHVSSDFYPAGRILVSHTIPTLLKGEQLGGEPQRLSTNIGLRGLTVNFYSRVVAVNIVSTHNPRRCRSSSNGAQFGTNGVIHGVDSILVPPPNVVKIIELLPGEFSTLELGLTKTGLIEALNKTSNHVGGTIFAPSNFAFQKLGPRINAFLFSNYGQKYLKAILEYHVVANHTLYSDAYYKAESVDAADIPKGFFHVRSHYPDTRTKLTFSP